MISRRRFTTGVVIALTPLGATASAQEYKAQQVGKTWRLGFLGGGSPSGYAPHVEALRLGLRDHGYVEGKNVTIEYRWAEGKYDRLAALARGLVDLNVDVIITQGTPAALRGQTDHDNDSYCHGHRRQSRRDRYRSQSPATRTQRHRLVVLLC